MSTITKTHVESLLEAVEAYRTAGNPTEVPLAEMAAWMVNNDLYDLPFEDKVKRLTKELQDALSKPNRMDPQGRRVRAWICARQKYTDPTDGTTRQRPLWDDAFTCSAMFAHDSATNRRDAIVSDCVSLDRDTRSQNENNENLKDQPIQLSFNFEGSVKASRRVDPKKPR